MPTDDLLSPEGAEEPTPEPEAPELPLLGLRDGLPPVVETVPALLEVCEGVAAGTGPA